MSDQELSSLQQVVQLFDSLQPAARERIHRYLAERFALSSVAKLPEGHADSQQLTNSDQRELPGLAQLTEDGALKITIRDLKARSAIDAARRLVYVTIAAHERLAGSAASSRKTVTPILRDWRLYDGNARRMIATDKGIVRSGDLLSLDSHARRDAERFMAEMLEDGTKGTWQAEKKRQLVTKTARKS
jgi:hypothetical protein